ncbi:monosaccharide ABC transporter membrane protein, CUT2 family [Thalassovita litoralis]|jgi:ribose transport system permease protein|uniref:Monosaccharide ABC transporter membrane protein, CUT2 family n=1 Tax=Thalassovita litoralis TaxID=1010611 RepID=A0A521BNL2_9RHOB|nr:ABC transporter permease [Thalassovita litoralis]SMO48341.1 monosaccharide ABC transporter membrane protein, CUT2 family [Thalassovita litoralis]
MLNLLRGRKLDQQIIVLILFILIFLSFAVFLPGFISAGNILTLVRSVSVLGILGLGMAIVVIGRGIDLSMIATLAVPAAWVMTLAGAGYPPVLAILAGLAFAIATGVLNGVLVAYAEIPALFATLAVGIGIAGIGQSGLFEYDIVAWPPALDSISWIGRGVILGIPYSILAFLAAALVVHIFLKKTRMGFFIYALGDNLLAARITGVRVRPIIILQYVMASVIALFAGLVLAASSANMDTRIFNLTWIYDVILVVVLGGIGLSGGRGGVWNVIIGTLLIGTIINGMTIMNVSFEGQNLVRGMVLLAALMTDSILNPRNEETAKQGDI